MKPSTPSNDVTDTENQNTHDVYEWELYTDLFNRQNTAINRLQDLTREADLLRKENTLLRKANEDLKRQLIARLLLTGSVPGTTLSCESPTSVIDERLTPIRRQIGGGDNGIHQNSTASHHLPNSISVRSNGYLKMNQSHHTSTEINANEFDIHGFVNPPTSPLHNNIPKSVTHQRLYLHKIDNEDATTGGGDTTSAARIMELEAYRQGTYKTELCNKWQETGICPYGSHCRFAHGVSELRPVLRHPRYKTEICRMILNGVTCPYGHRCHFRHSSIPPC